MSIATATRPTGARASWLRLAGWQAQGHWAVFGAFLLLSVSVVALILWLVRNATAPNVPGLQFTQPIGLWMPFAVAIHYVTSWFGPSIAAGMTRRTFIRASAAGIATFAATGALIVYLLLRLEQWVRDRLGMVASASPGRVNPAEVPVLPYMWGLFLLLLVWGLTGLLVGLSYARVGPWATVALPLTLLPIVAVALVGLQPSSTFVPFGARVSNGSYQTFTIGLDSTLASVVLGSAIVAATLVAIHLVSRRMPIRGPRA